jgi:hypothetical protein
VPNCAKLKSLRVQIAGMLIGTERFPACPAYLCLMQVLWPQHPCGLGNLSRVLGPDVDAGREVTLHPPRRNAGRVAAQTISVHFYTLLLKESASHRARQLSHQGVKNYFAPR